MLWDLMKLAIVDSILLSWDPDRVATTIISRPPPSSVVAHRKHVDKDGDKQTHVAKTFASTVGTCAR